MESSYDDNGCFAFPSDRLLIVICHKLRHDHLPLDSHKTMTNIKSLLFGLLTQQTIQRAVERSMTSRTCDIAVIGSGFAGLSAAIEASSILPPEAKILIIEKMSAPGGNSVMNAGQIAAVGSKQQQLGNIQDSVELMMSDMLKAGVDLNHPNLLRKLAEESNSVVKWTQEKLGIEYRERVTQLGGHSVPRTLR